MKKSWRANKNIVRKDIDNAKCISKRWIMYEESVYLKIDYVLSDVIGIYIRNK